MPYSRLFYHFVWSTHNRLPLITEANRDPLYAAMRAKVTELGGLTHALNGMPDHAHLLVTVPPKIALATFIGQVKGVSSHLASRLSTEAFAWQREYGVLSLSESHLPTVVRYVVEQQKHHAENSVDERLERWGGDNAPPQPDDSSLG
ncbi:MAG: IS200/IS605 family transposase [Chloroflexi bacterium]|nr:IS200/IS605 family transposase [Chloroflexota bacterium]